MASLFAVCLLIVSSCQIADEPPCPTGKPGYVVKIRFLEVRQAKTFGASTEVGGIRGSPLKIEVARILERRLYLEVQEVPGTQPTQYLVELRGSEVQQDGSLKVLFEPKLVTTVGRPATLKIGERQGDRIEVEISVREDTVAIPAASGQPNQPKPRTTAPATGKPPPPSVPSNLGTSRMQMVDPRLIIQEEEEERLPVQPSP
jgi:hypothetical protein